MSATVKLPGFVAPTLSRRCRGLSIREPGDLVLAGRVPLGGTAGCQPALRVKSSWMVSLLAWTLVLTAASAFGQEAGRAGTKDFSAFKVIVDRNIFDPNRRPHVASGPTPTIVDWFALTGTLSYNKGTFAVFDGSGADYHKVLESGGKIAGYTLTRIGADFADLTLGSNHVELRVGMQMHRNEDGTWESAEAAVASATPASTRRQSGRHEFTAGRMRPRGNGTEVAASPTPPEQADTSGASPEAPPADNPDSSTLAPSPDAAGNNNPDDPVARMMRRRMQETGGNANNSPNP